MKLCTFSTGNDPKLGIHVDDRVVDLNLAQAVVSGSGTRKRWNSLVGFLEDGPAGIQAAKSVVSALGVGDSEMAGPGGQQIVFAEDSVTFLAPIERPPKVMCIAGNYMEHIQEGHKEKVDRPKDIHVFTKVGPHVTVAPNGTVTVSKAVTKLDYEMEIGVVIGKAGRFIPEDRAAEHIGGYTCFNDISDRGFMPSEGKMLHWFAMKSQDNGAPVGPYVLLASGEPSPIDLEMKLWVNGELRQNARTTEMIFPPAWIVSRLSHWVTLEVGDIIATGTPAGNAWSRQEFLKDGDVVEHEIEKIGRLKNTIRFEEPVYRC